MVFENSSSSSSSSSCYYFYYTSQYIFDACLLMCVVPRPGFPILTKFEFVAAEDEDGGIKPLSKVQKHA